MKDIHKYIEDSIYRGVKDSLSAGTFSHSLNVAKTGLDLALKYRINSKKTVIACFLHDCAKDMSNRQLNALFKKYKIKKDTKFPELTVDYHAKVGAEIARDTYGIHDKEILDAIRYHTVGKSGMSRIAKAVYIADFIEVGRKHIACKKLRSVFRKGETGLNGLVAGVIREKLRYLGDNGYTIHTGVFELLKEVE